MNRQRLELQDNPYGLQPEQVLVLETIGPIQDFLRAVKEVPGLEWLGELEVDGIAPADGFEAEKHPEKELKGQLFLVMTDQLALRELQSLFRGWQRNPAAKFRRGFAPWKHAFEHLRAIRPWDAEDRVRDTGLLEDWQERNRQGQETVPFEMELWFRENADRRQRAQSFVGDVIASAGGEAVQQCVIPEIAYHGILGRVPVASVLEVLSKATQLQNFRLLQCRDIMHVRPVGQCTVHLPDDVEGLQVLADQDSRRPPEGQPVIALFDGVPLAHHRAVDGCLAIDDPDGYEDAYQAKERIHGTAMASLICCGDLSENGGSLDIPLYVRPIMQPDRGHDGTFTERIPEGILPVDLVHRAVRRLYESENGEPPAAPSVRVINLSVCDRSRPFDLGMSSWARLIDWLAWKYNVLFVVSAGNHPHDIELDITKEACQDLSPEEREGAIIRAIAADTRHRRLLSPAETLNGLSVGATHADASGPSTGTHLIDPLCRTSLPNTVSAHGPGYRRAVKPDILLPGGRQLLMEKPASATAMAVLQTHNFARSPGQCVAAPGISGELNRTWYTRGTSNAAAIASRNAAFLYAIIESLRAQAGVNLPSAYDAVLLKTLLVHGADWADAKAVYESTLRNPQNSAAFIEYVGHFLGYGSPNVTKVMACTDQRVTILGVGKLEDGEGHEFHFPLPPGLSAVTHKRRLTITLAWLSPMNCMRQNYRIAHLWFDPKNALAPKRVCADHDAVQRGTVQHEVLEGDKAVDFQDGERILVKVNCRADAGDIPEAVRYGLAVTLEVAEGIDIPVYQEVRDRLRVRIPARGEGAT